MAREVQEKPGRTIDEVLTEKSDWVVAEGRQSALLPTEVDREAVAMVQLSRRAIVVAYDGKSANSSTMRWMYMDADQAEAAARNVAARALRGEFDGESR